jgi:hypothetical protein
VDPGLTVMPDDWHYFPDAKAVDDLKPVTLLVGVHEGLPQHFRGHLGRHNVIVRKPEWGG